MQLWGRKAKMSRDKYFSTKKSRLYILTQESLLEWRLPEEKAGEVMYDQILFNQEKGRGFRLHGGGGGSSSRDDYGYIYIYTTTNAQPLLLHFREVLTGMCLPL